MRLLDVATCSLQVFYGNSIPLYAILSHTWLQDDEEVTFNEIFSASLADKPPWLQKRGAAKIKFLCAQAQRDGYEYAWIDTCCIDKSNSTELSEAINSMYQWYEKSQVCYVFLEDVGHESDFLSSRWWTRAWTLQELLAPSSVLFFDTNHRIFGSKASMAAQIAMSTGIDEHTLKSPYAMFFTSVARRMSWAAHRQASRAEDLAYALLGIFEINMPMQYGEGEKAFVRLQREIMKTTNDQSLFAWGFSPEPLENILAFMPTFQPAPPPYGETAESVQASEAGLFAPHPRYFAACGDIIAHSALDHSQVDDTRIEEKQGVFSIESLSIIRSGDLPETDILSRLDRYHRIVLLPCSIPGAPHSVLGILLQLWHWHHHSQNQPARAIRDDIQGAHTFPVSSDLATKALTKKYMVDPLQWVTRYRTFAKDATGVRAGSALKRTLIIDIQEPFLTLHKQWQPTGWQWHSTQNTLLCSTSGPESDQPTLRFLPTLPLKGKESKIVVHASLWLGSNEYIPDQIRFQTIPVAQIGAPLSERQMHEGVDVSMVKGEGVFRCQKMEVNARVSTRYIFNQAVTTIVVEGLWRKRAREAERKRANEDEKIRASGGAMVGGAVAGGFILGSAFG
ncbi:HET-domain-containing protein [Plenodomus tracheiphilus IPT5]|uniref:HET-domain-containing protein n=1 Tax=Plenodomus tracheiphilus IPT5 TaxID=1408161 RepID=A0A6A7B0L1_9PLEO|nr:HET-domain-containing protein [Plenodomus tracheiphilus IPT5]